jgi:hypothetical protein
MSSATYPGPKSPIVIEEKSTNRSQIWSLLLQNIFQCAMGDPNTSSVMSTGSGLLRASVGGRAAPLYMQVAV